MKNNIILYTMLISTFTLFQLTHIQAQSTHNSPKWGLSIQGGAYVPSFEAHGIKIGSNIGYEMNFSFHNRLMVALHANYGWSRYKEELPRDAPDGEIIGRGGSNADYTTIHIGPMIGYAMIEGARVRLNAFVGATTITEMKDYPYIREEYDEDLDQVFYSTDYKNSSHTDIAFPIKCELNFANTKSFSISLVGGFYFLPENPVTGLHFGPQLNWKF